MAVIRQQNWLGQQRVDVQHLRALDSGTCGDFDLLAGTIVANRTAYVLQGFSLATLAAGNPASNLQLSVSGGALMHPAASEVGTIFNVPSGRTVETLNVSNSRVSGGFTASAVNYIGVDLRRSADTSTADLVQFLDESTLAETPETVPLARTLDYVIVISTQDFSSTPTVAPLAKVTTDSSNNIVTLEDARNMFGRLGKGGSVTTPLYAYAWPGGRTEVGDNSDFGAADKAIPSLKDWMDAAMTRLWEIGGGQHWYSPTADRNVQLIRNGTTLFTDGDFFEWTGTNLHWRELRFVFDNTTGWYNDVADQLTDNAGQTDLADGQCIYVDIDRSTNRTGGTALVAQKATTATLGQPTVPGSRWIIAWRVGSNVFVRGNSYAVGTTFNPATTTSIGMVKLLQTSGTPTTPVVFNPDANGGLTYSATGGNRTALIVTGNGSGAGVFGTGGGSSGVGVTGTGGAGTGHGVTGNGTGNGSGVVGTGAGNGSGVVATGGATGPAIMAIEANGNIKPDILTEDYSGNVRTTIADHLGLPTFGNTAIFRERWDGFIQPLSATTTAVSTGQRWNFYTLNSSTLAAGAPATTYPKQQALLAATANAGAYATLYTAAQQVHLGFTGLSFALEWDANPVYTFTVAAYMGLDGNAASGDLSAATQYIRFVLPNNGANWHAQCNNGGAGADVDTGVANSGASGALIRFRIEVYGSSSPLGAATAKFYINGQLKATITTFMPTGIMNFGFQIKNTGGSGVPQLFLGRIDGCWNLALNPSNPM